MAQIKPTVIGNDWMKPERKTRERGLNRKRGLQQTESGPQNGCCDRMLVAGEGGGQVKPSTKSIREVNAQPQ
jgi:hypothetical protein